VSGANVLSSMMRTVSSFVLCAGVAVAVHADQPTPRVPVFRKSQQVWPRNVNTRIAAFADLDGDGDLDGVFASMWSPSLVLVNDGHGRFVASAQPLPDEMHDIALGDVDGDGDVDLLFAPIRPGGGPPLYLNDGRGRFTPSPLTVGREELATLVDIDADGDLDALLINNGLYVNDGKGGFSRSAPLGFHPLKFGDLNGDGASDAIGEDRIHLNDRRGRLGPSDALPAERGEMRAGKPVLADVNRDGYLDVVVPGTGQPSRVWFNDGKGRLRDSGQRLPSVAQGWGFAGVGDLTGDGAVDIVITNKDEPAQVWVNDGKGTFSDSGVRLGDGIGNTWTNAVLADFDRDGDVDVFITNRSSGRHGLWFNLLAETRQATRPAR